MSSNIDRYRPAREAYPPPSSLPPKPPTSLVERPSKSPSRRRDNVPPAVPTPPSLSSRTSPPRPHSRRSAESPAHSSSPRHQKPRRDQWLFTREEVLSTPSIIGGMSVAEERLRRAKGINFIKQAGVLLTLPATTVWVACVFFHRFYMRHSMEPEKGGIHHYNIAATSLFLANKTEEICRKTKDVIIAVGKVAQKDSKLELDEQSKEYWRWRDSILAFEEVMLESLTFDLSVDNPLSELRKQFKQLNLPSECALKESTWAFCNDACLTVLPLLLSAKDVACGALFFALTVSKTQLEDIDGRPWWEIINGTEENIALAVNTLSDFYRDNPIRKKDPNIPASPLFDLGGTRRLAGTPTPTSPRPKVNGKSEGSSNHYQSQQHEINTNGNNNAVGAKEASVPPAVKQEDEGEQRDRVASEAAPPRPSIEVSTSEQQRGDSDAALKAAANDLSIHDRPYRPKAEDDGGGLVSPQKFSKRKSAELEEGEERAERETKKQRLEGDVKQERIEDEDEGEIKGS